VASKRKARCAILCLIGGVSGVFNWLVDFVFPKKCVGCGKYEVFLCNGCEKEMELAEQICPMCFRPNLGGWTHEKCRKKLGVDGLMAIWSYKNGVVQEVVENIKFGFNRELMGMTLEKVTFESGIKFDFLVPMPLYYLRENWRGFNQAEEMAKVVAKRMNLPVSKLLKRDKNTKQQAMLTKAVERKKNMRGAFSLDKEVRLSGLSLKNKNVLLIDDVFTSGESMKECTRVLKRAGVEKMWGLVMAR